VLPFCGAAVVKSENGSTRQHSNTAIHKNRCCCESKVSEQMKIDKFEDIHGWQEARILTKKIYDLTNSFPFKKDLALCSQIQKASVSIMANTRPVK